MNDAASCEITRLKLKVEGFEREITRLTLKIERFERCVEYGNDEIERLEAKLAAATQDEEVRWDSSGRRIPIIGEINQDDDLDPRKGYHE